MNDETFPKADLLFPNQEKDHDPFEHTKYLISSFLKESLALSEPSEWITLVFPLLQKYNSMLTIPLSENDLSQMYASMTDSSPISTIENGIVFLKSSSIVAKPIDWLWEGKIAKGKVTLIAGDPGLGKSQLTIHLASIVSNGGLFPGDHKCKRGKVLFFSAEDDAADTINPRLIACGANQDFISIFSLVKRNGKEKFFDLSTDIDLLKETLENDRGISLIVIDPITAFLGETDSHKNADVRALLSQFSKLASAYGIAIIVVTHLNKSTGGSPLNKITGSLAFVAAARAAYMVMKDENDEGRRLFLPVKNNLADDKGGYAFKIEGYAVTPEINTSRIAWEAQPVTMTALQAMNEQKDGDGGVDREVVTWLENYLRERPEGVSFDILQKEAFRRGISKRTLYRAEKNVFVDKVYAGKNKPKLWKLAFDEGNGDDITTNE